MNNKIRRYFNICREVAKKGDCKEAQKHYKIGALGIRGDNCVVVSFNVTTKQRAPQAHAEFRLCKKLNQNSIVYVVRIGASGNFLCAHPCKSCRLIMKFCGVRRCYYSILDDEYGIIEF